MLYSGYLAVGISLERFGFFVDNRAEGRSCRWETLCIVYNSKSTPERLTLPGGTWELLADGESSFLWKSPVRADANIAAAPGSILILGKDGGR